MIKKIILLLVLAIGFLFVFTACNNHGLDEINLVIILGNRANTYALSDAEFDIMQQYIERSFAPTGREANARANVAFIISDGTPLPITSITSVNDWRRSWWDAGWTRRCAGHSPAESIGWRVPALHSRRGAAGVPGLGPLAFGLLFRCPRWQIFG